LSLLKKKLQSLLFFLIASKYFSNLDNGEDLWEEEEEWTWYENGVPLFGNLNYKSNIFVKLWCSLYLSCFSSLNFYSLSLDCLCNFLTKFSAALHFGDKKW
jgi:hypothetical protein